MRDGAGPDPVAGPPGPHPDGDTRIVVVRHGETTWGAAGRFTGRQDVPLTARGTAEAASVAERVARLTPALVLTSPLQRCRVTAEAIGAASGIPVLVSDGLIDGLLGDWTGFTAADIERRWPAEFARWRADPAAPPPGGESFDGIRARVAALLDDVVSKHPGHTVVLVTHAATTKMLLVVALRAPSEVAYRIRVDTASVSGLTVRPDGTSVVWAVNEVGHLPD